jgi:hypothetical protein
MYSTFVTWSAVTPQPHHVAWVLANRAESVAIDRPGGYAIYTPPPTPSRVYRCRVTDSAGTPLTLHSPSRRRAFIDYDTYMVLWSGSFNVSTPGSYTVFCTGGDPTDSFKVASEPAVRTVFDAARTHPGFIAGAVVAGVAVVMITARLRARALKP